MLLHVLRQVGLLRVGFPTVRTDVSLQVLGLLVLRDVIQEGGLVMETFIAGVTLVGFVSLMTPGVRQQVGQLGEGLGATWNIYPVSFLSRLQHQVRTYQHGDTCRACLQCGF